MKTHSQKFLQQRKFAMVMPTLVLPFIVMIFWSLGGGSGSPIQTTATTNPGLNLTLPDAQFDKDEQWDKLRLYEKADREEHQFQEEKENDPYFNLADLSLDQVQDPVKGKDNNIAIGNLQSAFPSKTTSVIDPNEEKVNQKLEQLYTALNKSQHVVPDKTAKPARAVNPDPEFSSDVQKLEQMMELMSNTNQSDPEMQQLESMLEKILDIQHPERVRDKMKPQSDQKNQQTFAVTLSDANNTPSTIDSRSDDIQSGKTDSTAFLSKIFSVQPQRNSFYGLDDETNPEQPASNTIEAVIHETQELVAGATVKMRLLNDIYINDKLISKDQFIYGTCSIEAERLTISINSIQSDNTLFPVAMSAYDLDGLEGIYVPGAITRDAAKQSSDQAMQSMQFMTMDQSIGAQAASAGLQAAKGLFSKKVKLIRVTVKAGYKILLVDKHTDH